MADMQSRGWRHYAAAAALTGLVFLVVRGCVFEYGVRDALRERAQAERQAQARAALALRAAVDTEVGALRREGRYQQADRVASQYQATQGEMDREVERFLRWQATQPASNP